MGGQPSSLKDMDVGRVINKFKVRYVGSVPVKAAVGNDVARTAVERLRNLRVKAKPIRLKVTTLGVYLIDDKTNDVVKEVDIKTITFVAQDPVDEHVVRTRMRLCVCVLGTVVMVCSNSSSRSNRAATHFGSQPLVSC